MTRLAEPNGTAIVGGGISGLMAALAAVENGETDVHVYEASNRLGGKIMTGRMGKEFGNRPVNMGGETIASDEKGMIDLAKKLGVPLIQDSGGQTREAFYTPEGKHIPDFVEQYGKFYFEKTEKIRREMERDPKFVEVMHGVSAETFVTKLRDQSAEQFINEQRLWAKPSWGITDYVYAAASWAYTQGARLTNMATGNRPSQKIVDAALAAAQNEEGALAKDIAATLYVAEFCPNPGRFEKSDCGLRVEGGTTALIDALEEKLKQSGVKFHMGHKLEALQKNGDEKVLIMSTPEGEKTITTGKAVLALPAYALPKIRGLEFLKMDQSPVQYTKNTKFTVMVKPGADLPDQNAFCKYSESWTPEEGMHTFLCLNEKGEDKDTMMKKVMADYARAMGKRVDEIFYVDKGGKPIQGSYVYTNPGDAPCWSTPSPLNAASIAKLFSKMEALAAQGIAFVGTYLPTAEGCTGFMQCGAESVERMSGRMFGAGRVMEQEVTLSQQIPPLQHGFAARERAGQHAGNKGMSPA